jgi:hypothetical protein
VIRKVCIALVAGSVVLFGVSFLEITTSNASGAWGGALMGSVLGFVVGILGLQFAGQGMGRAQGPTSFSALDSGALAQPAPGDDVRPTRTWTRSWMNVYFWTAAGELFLASLFVIAGIASGEPDGITGGLVTGGILGAVGLGLGYAGYRTWHKDRLHVTGLEGRATVVGIKQTGMWLNNNPVTVLDLRIKLDGHPEYEVRHRETVPQVAIGRLTNGMTLPVRVNPDNPSDFVIEWEQG